MIFNVSIVTYMTPTLDVLKAATICAKSSVVKNIFIIDNSPNDSLREIVGSLSKIIYIFNPSNPGYGAGHNLGIRRSISDDVRFHLVLNADVIFDFDILEDMANYATLNDQVGLIAPKMLYEDGSIQCNRKLLPTPINLLLRAFFPKKYWSRLNDQYQLESFGYDQAISVPSISGAFMLFRTSVIEQVGLFDERFFMYAEDIDLSRRAALVSEVRFVPDFTIIHKYGGATWKSRKMFIVHAFNVCLYFNKWGWIFDKSRGEINKRVLEQEL